MYPTIQVFKPTLEEFSDFNTYIQYMESQNAHLAGIAKIIAPVGWKPRERDYNTKDIMDMTIPHPIRQVTEGSEGMYKMASKIQKPMKVKDFKKLAEEKRLKGDFTNDEIKRKYWNNLTYSPPLYGADVPESISDETLEIWNINKLGSILDYTMKDYGITISGVNTAYLYFGMWRSSFAWHTEDMDLYSINYLHYGHPKTWYAIPPRHGFRFEALAKELYRDEARYCPAFLRHKSTVIAPNVLKTHAIPVNTVTQEEGEIIITFPFGYHAGFNHGFNIAESTNFATPRWVEYGKRSKLCHCRRGVVKINMDTFVKKFQPEKYKNWRQGKDVGFHPEDPSRKCLTPRPPIGELSSDEENSSNSKHKKPKRK